MAVENVMTFQTTRGSLNKIAINRSMNGTHW